MHITTGQTGSRENSSAFITDPQLFTSSLSLALILFDFALSEAMCGDEN